MQTLQKTNYPALYTLVVVFFFWGFMAAGNNIFIPFCKEYFHLDQFQSQLIDFAFYTAYYVGAFLLFVIGNSKGKDLVMSWGYKKSIIFGLLFSTIGAIAMILAVEADVYFGMLVGFFIVALGFSLQQTAANPFAISLGDEKTGASRVNLGGGINSLGTTVGPLIVAYALFGVTTAVTDNQIKELSLDKVVLLYACVGLLFIGAATLFATSKKLPNIKTEEPFEKANKAVLLLSVMTVLLLVCMVPVFLSYKSDDFLLVESLKKQFALQPNEALESQIVTLLDSIEMQRMMWLSFALVAIIGSLVYALLSAKKNTKGWGAMQYPQLVLGMIAIFTYVGVEVGVGSNLAELLKLPEFGGFSSSEVAPYVSMYWGSMMIGRWAGAVYAFHFEKIKERMLIIVMPILAFLVIIGANFLMGYDVSHLYGYIACVILQIVIILATKNHPSRTLFACSVLGAISIILGLNLEGYYAIYAFLTAGLACSVIWPAIFNLALMGLGKYTAQGSAFLVMMILGGGIFPPIQGKLADIIGIHNSYIVSLLCFVYLILFGFLVNKVLKRQNLL